jgi:hypothetical protein
VDRDGALTPPQAASSTYRIALGRRSSQQLDHLCRYITRLAIANERLKRKGAGQVVLQLKSSYKDSTTHIVMSPLESMQRLAALGAPSRACISFAPMACSH